MDAIDLARNRLIFALDIEDPAEALACARELRGTMRSIKVATRLYTQAGSSLVNELHGLGFRVFLDLKFHDIPDQVEGACRAAAKLGVGLLTVHASGGRAMLEAAARGAAEGSRGQNGVDTLVLAVTVLTSLDASDLSEMGVHRPVEEQVLALARLAHEAGCGGIVASPKELPMLRPALPRPFGILTPGIRPAGAAIGDQKRVTTPGDAIRGGADWLVVGRPIRNAEDRVAAANAILEEMAAAS